MSDLIRALFVKASRKFEKLQHSSQTSTFRFRPGVAVFTGMTFYLVLQMWKTPHSELSDDEHVGLFMRERIELKRETDRQFKKLRYQYLRSQRENHKYFESDLTRMELNDLHEEAEKRAKDIIRDRLTREEQQIDRLYGGIWYTIKRTFGLAKKPQQRGNDGLDMTHSSDNTNASVATDNATTMAKAEIKE